MRDLESEEIFDRFPITNGNRIEKDVPHLANIKSPQKIDLSSILFFS
jgi:hypothetical protein